MAQNFLSNFLLILFLNQSQPIISKDSVSLNKTPTDLLTIILLSAKI